MFVQHVDNADDDDNDVTVADYDYVDDGLICSQQDIHKEIANT